MKNDKIVNAYNAMKPEADAKDRVRAKIMQQAAKKNSGRQLYKRAVAVVATAAVILLVVFGTNLLNQTRDILLPENPFAMRVYAMELQPDGTYIWREVDITQLDGWGMYYDGEVLYIGLGLWFEFEGENISTVEFSLEDGFFATQYIGNRGAVPNTPSWHIAIYPDFTTSRLVMYGDEFEKIGSTITFGDTMPDDILLFWGSYDRSYTDWWLGTENMVVEIDIKVTFEDGEIHRQPLVLDFYENKGFGMGWFHGELPEDDTARLDWFTAAQLEYVKTAPLEHFTLVPGALTEVLFMEAFGDHEAQYEHVFYIGGHDPFSIMQIDLWMYHDLLRMPMGVQDGKGFVVIMTRDEDGEILAVNAYSIPLN